MKFFSCSDLVSLVESQIFQFNFTFERNVHKKASHKHCSNFSMKATKFYQCFRRVDKGLDKRNEKSQIEPKTHLARILAFFAFVLFFNLIVEFKDFCYFVR